MSQRFRAWVVDKSNDSFSLDLKELTVDDLSPGEVVVRVAWSGVNYKDGLAGIPDGNVVETYPLIPGIDLAGTVVHSDDPRYKEGDEVIVASAQLGVSHDGGFSEMARVPGDWIIPLPEGLTLKEAMVYGTAGFTAAMSIQRMEENGLNPEKGPVLVAGATGGVGSTAVAMLAKRGYTVVCGTGKSSEHDYLRQLGASEILSREELSGAKRPLQKRRWAGAVDPVGGETLTYLLSTMDFGGCVALSGLAGGPKFSSTVFPFILRGVNLLGIDSAHISNDFRRKVWNRLAADLKPEGQLPYIGAEEITLEELPRAMSTILEGGVRGRILVQLS
ncbi:putative quinone oxidoreductase, YhdH/YhfP family [Melghirimyces thermohalophilus]|uniref:Putative quinone oxidoreductase, YhdH/YhfP family n=1 Tax=Melghirimyces thermohalophilus TaxID=1236220 RepID=A0A1G6K159_9BACL|nr:acryloyl-CoA reductase [Melghirimyces thermohalophilus]SDC24638.1 putative quinone oxidoreductase, YhdH/YhfP family [Melghirimyces thermohalophilus]